MLCRRTATLSRDSKDCLTVPVVTAIVGFCGSAVTTNGHPGGRNRKDTMEENISLVEFYDSDASAMEWLSDDDKAGVHDDRGSQERML